MSVVVSILLALCVLFIAGMTILSLSATRPGNLGHRDGQLAACPGTPNCVSTQAEDRQHWIAPLEVPDHLTDPIASVRSIVESMSGASVISSDESYLYAEFRTFVFRFCDDVEFLLDSDGRRIHLRSASRVGRSDLGVNRNRMDEVRRRWNEAVTSSPAIGRDHALRKDGMLAKASM